LIGYLIDLGLDGSGGLLDVFLRRATTPKQRPGQDHGYAKTFIHTVCASHAEESAI
jgi:hypothetical protein